MEQTKALLVSFHLSRSLQGHVLRVSLPPFILGTSESKLGEEEEEEEEMVSNGRECHQGGRRRRVIKTEIAKKRHS